MHDLDHKLMNNTDTKPSNFIKFYPVTLDTEWKEESFQIWTQRQADRQIDLCQTDMISLPWLHIGEHCHVELCMSWLMVKKSLEAHHFLFSWQFSNRHVTLHFVSPVLDLRILGLRAVLRDHRALGPAMERGPSIKWVRKKLREKLTSLTIAQA